LHDRLFERYEIIVANRERTTFDSKLLASLPRLRLLITTGMRNAQKLKQLPLSDAEN
jgi:hypothetical protein